MSKLIMENVMILEDYNLIYKANKCTYKITSIYNCFKNEIRPVVYIFSHNKLDNLGKFFSSRLDIIPENHCDILLELFEIYKNKVILPMILTDNIKYINNLIFAKGLKDEE